MAFLEALQNPRILSLREGLREWLGRGWSAVRRYQNALALFVLRKFLIPVILFITYFLAFGIMALFLRVFGRKFLGTAPKLAPGSNWVEAQGYGPDRLQLMQQS